MFEHFRELIILTQGDEYGTSLYQPYIRNYNEREEERAQKIVCSLSAQKRSKKKSIEVFSGGLPLPGSVALLL